MTATKPQRLSTAQQSILRRLAKGERLRAFAKSHISGGYWSPSFDNFDTVPVSSVNALVANGLVVSLPRKIGEFFIVYEITEEGRKLCTE